MTHTAYHRPDILAATMAQRQNMSLSRAFYTDPDFFAADIDLIWTREWIFATPAAEIPKTGNYVTVEIGLYSVVIVRGSDGIARAFHNACRHRGSRICQKSKGTNPKLVCPYHQWTYELDGRLLWARDMGADFDPGKFGLKKVHAEDVGGMIYICLAVNAPDISQLKEHADRYMAPHAVRDLKIAHTTSTVEAGNWKLVMENNRECYHCAGNHPALTRTFDENPNAAGIESGKSDPIILEHEKRCEASGLPSKFVRSADGAWRLVRVPLLGTSESYTMDGKIGSQKLLPHVTIKQAGTLLYYSYPNSWNHFLSDVVTLFRIVPISPTETQLTTWWLVHPDAQEGRDYDLKRLTEVWDMTNREDQHVVEQNQLGILSPAYTPGPYSVAQEMGVIEFVNWYVDTMKRHLTTPHAIAAE